MRRAEYRAWLDGIISPVCIKDRISRCANLEKMLGIDLDNEFQKDGGKQILELLKNTSKDFRAGKNAPDCFKFKEGINVRQKLFDLHLAVKHYFVFCTQTQPKA